MKNRFSVFVLGIFMISQVFALGITPGRTTLDFEKGLSRTVSFDIINSEQTNMKLVFAVDGDLAEYVTLETESAEVLATEHKKTFTYTLNLPEKLEPGLQTAKVYAIRLPDADSSGDTSVAATLAVATQIHVNVPYPGKYASSNLIIYNSNVGESTIFVFPVESRGEFDLTNVYANVDVYNAAGQKVGSFDTKSIEIPSGEKKELIHKWKNDLSVGDYKAVATLVYDEGSLALEGEFSIGEENLELQDITVNEFNLGEIAKLEMLVENKWTQAVDDVYVETRILDNDDDMVSNFKSSSNSIDASSKEVFMSYWDTAGVKEGTYKAEVEIKYGDESSSKNLQFEVSKNELVVIGLGYVISSGGNSGDNSVIVILVVAIVVLVLINGLWFMLLRKKMSKK